MCLILIAHQAHPKYPLVIAANRDEFFSRPSAEAHFWHGENGASKDHNPVLAGKDITAGGTWMGVTKTGRLAAVTNVREPHRAPPSDAISRGHLVTGFLTSDKSCQDYQSEVMQHQTRYSGFNLICGLNHQLWHMSNRNEQATKLEPGIHGLSNATLNTPWPKVSEGKKELQHLLRQSSFSLPQLLPLLTHKQTAPSHTLPHTGVGEDMEKVLSARFIEHPASGYGTRTSTLVRLNNQGQMEFAEWTWNINGELQQQVEFEFALEI